MKLRKGTMRAASLIVIFLFILGACQKREEDFILRSQSPNGNIVALFRGYQPRGISKGIIVLTFVQEAQQSDDSATVFDGIENAEIAWLSDSKLIIIADQIKYRNIDSDYFPDGTINSRVRLVICERQEMDCSSLDKRIKNSRPLHRIASFPER